MLLCGPQAKCLAGCVLRKVFYIWFPIKARHLIDCPNLHREVWGVLSWKILLYTSSSALSRGSIMQRGMDPRVRGPRVTKNGKVASLIKRVRITHEIPFFNGMHGTARQSNSPACDLPLDIYAKIVKAGATYIDGPKWPLKCRINHYGQLY